MVGIDFLEPLNMLKKTLPQCLRVFELDVVFLPVFDPRQTGKENVVCSTIGFEAAPFHLEMHRRRELDSLSQD